MNRFERFERKINLAISSSYLRGGDLSHSFRDFTEGKFGSKWRTSVLASNLCDASLSRNLPPFPVKVFTDEYFILEPIYWRISTDAQKYFLRPQPTADVLSWSTLIRARLEEVGGELHSGGVQSVHGAGVVIDSLASRYLILTARHTPPLLLLLSLRLHSSLKCCILLCLNLDPAHL